MAGILYILRRPLDTIDQALLPSDVTHEIILLESAVPQSRKDCGIDVILSAEKETERPLSYKDLVEKIFSSDRPIVI